MSQFRWGGVSITGNFRENNEDRCLADPDGRYFLVADGMGGQSAGEKASEMAVELISRKLEQLVDFDRDTPEKVGECIDKAVSHANEEIMALSELDPAYHNMGTTVAMLVRAADKLCIAGIGDSRAYLLRDGQLQRLTQDHSLSEALLEAGTITKEEAARHRYRNVLYRYLGTKEGSSGAKARPIEFRAGDRFIACSDGATEGASEEQLTQILASHDDPQKAAESVVAAAQAGGSKDNITCLAVFVD